MDQNLPAALLRRIEELVDASYSGRDELYAAADQLTQEDHRQICQRLADQLANHATELQQLLLINEQVPVEPLDLYEIAERFFEIAKARDGEFGVLKTAEECEKVVRERLEEVIQEANEGDTHSLLERQRNDVVFGEQVLRSMRIASDGETAKLDE